MKSNSFVGVSDNLNANLRGLRKSATLRMNELSHRLVREGKEVFKLGFGQSPFPVPGCVVDALKASAQEKDYLPVHGLGELREAVAVHNRRTIGLECDPDEVLIGPGSKELMFLLQFAFDGDLVLPVPSWVSYAPQGQLVGHSVRWLPTRFEDDWLLDPAVLEDLCASDPSRRRLLILNYPSNPTGSTFSHDQLRALAEICAKYAVIVLSDEIYGETHHDGKHASIARFYPEGTIVSGGLSKWCGAGGWRLGTFTFAKSLRWLREAVAVVASETYSSAATPVQYAAVRAFQGGPEIEHYLCQCRRVLKALAERVALQLNESGIRVAAPKGGFYLFPDFSPLQDRFSDRAFLTSEMLCGRLLEETCVALLPGRDFGCKPENLTARLAYVDFDGTNALAAAEETPLSTVLDEQFLRAHCGRTLTAVDRLCDWVQADLLQEG